MRIMCESVAANTAQVRKHLPQQTRSPSRSLPPLSCAVFQCVFPDHTPNVCMRTYTWVCESGFCLAGMTTHVAQGSGVCSVGFGCLGNWMSLAKYKAVALPRCLLCLHCLPGRTAWHLRQWAYLWCAHVTLSPSKVCPHPLL